MASIPPRRRGPPTARTSRRPGDGDAADGCHAQFDGVRDHDDAHGGGAGRARPVLEAVPFDDLSGSVVAVDAAVVQSADTLGTAYADATFEGATQVPVDDVVHGATALRERLESVDGPSYTYCYVSDLDSASHDYGTDSAAYHDALATATRALSRALYDDLDPATADETLLVVTADHGFVDFEPGPEGCLDVFSIDAVTESLARTSSGDPVRPWGDYRFLHLAVRDGAVDRACRALEAHGATVLTREGARDCGCFGPEAGPVFDRRCGDLVCTHPDLKLVYPSAESIVPKTGMHGGPTPREMVVPFAAARLSNLQ
ncbi:hypothetical protein BRD06_04220 [Halobacteriales archaeon QS_9_67_15]|nr:MAG: hypothetical protein BRD06_04220 [Halobacteriales archaeon QS_9_67_15]